MTVVIIHFAWGEVSIRLTRRGVLEARS